MAEHLLVADGLGKTYGDVVKTTALSDVTFSVERGEFASVIGQSGSGKSTLLNLIGLLDTPTTGQVLVDGRETAALGRRGRARLRNELLGFVFQFHHLLPEFSVVENVLMPGLIAGRDARRSRVRAEEVLALLGLEGLEDQNANELSGGQKQRVLAEENIEELVDVPGFLRRDDGDFVLRVVGDSMVDAGILDGDLIVVHPQSDADNGAIVVALVGDEATTKRFYRQGRSIRLQAENENYEPIVLDEAEVSVVGKVVGVLRRL